MHLERNTVNQKLPKFSADVFISFIALAVRPLAVPDGGFWFPGECND